MSKAKSVADWIGMYKIAVKRAGELAGERDDLRKRLAVMTALKLSEEERAGRARDAMLVAESREREARAALAKKVESD